MKNSDPPHDHQSANHVIPVELHVPDSSSAQAANRKAALKLRDVTTCSMYFQDDCTLPLRGTTCQSVVLSGGPCKLSCSGMNNTSGLPRAERVVQRVVKEKLFDGAGELGDQVTEIATTLEQFFFTKKFAFRKRICKEGPACSEATALGYFLSQTPAIIMHAGVSKWMR
jgi:hypothetical protein